PVSAAGFARIRCAAQSARARRPDYRRRAFPGLDAQRQALEHGVRITGATVHLVTSELDSGPIVLQAAVPVPDDDTVDTLSARILIEEHRIYPEAIRIVLDGGWSIAGRRFVLSGR